MVVDVEIASAQGTRTIQGVNGPTIVIGRADGSGVMLKHDDVSRKHAQVDLVDGGITVRDLSTNGTFVGGKRVMGALKLPFGTPSTVGPFTLRFRPPGMKQGVAGGIDARKLESQKFPLLPAVVAEGAQEVQEELPPPRKPPPAPPRKPAPSQPALPANVPDLSDQERDRLKRWLRGLLLEALDLPSLRPEELQDKALGPRVLQLMDELL